MARLAVKRENQKQSLLFPPSLDGLIPGAYVVRVVNGVIGRLDLGCLREGHKGGGDSCCNPGMMLKILVYGYLNNIYPSRKIEQEAPACV